MAEVGEVIDRAGGRAFVVHRQRDARTRLDRTDPRSRATAIAGVTALSVVGIAACSSSGSTPTKDGGSMMHTTTTSGGSMMNDKGK